MKKFLEFIETLNENLYENLMHRLVKEKIPCALLASNQINNFHINIANQLQKSGVDLRYIATVDDLAPKPPKNLQFISVSSLNSFGHEKPRFIFVTGGMEANMLFRRFTELGIDPILISPSGSTRSFGDFYLSHLRDLFDVYNSFRDEESKDHYLGFILARTTNNLSHCKFENSSQYVLNGFVPKPNEIVIDGGSCDGRTAAMFADFGCKVYSFEMDRENFEIASKLASEKDFVLENLGLADESKEISYKHDPQNIGGSFIDHSNRSPAKTQLTTLDLYVREKKLPSVDFIKLDIEGAELSMLKGAADSITRFKPKLAISAYHKREDVFTLAKFLKSLRPDYEFAFRQYESSYEYVPFMFTERILKICDKFNLPRKCSGLGEAVLFGR